MSKSLCNQGLFKGDSNFKQSINTLLEKNNLSHEELETLKDEYFENKFFKVKMDKYLSRVINMDAK